MNTCKTCKFFFIGDPDPNSLQRQMMCRRNPPQVIPVPIPGGFSMAGFCPPVNPEHWCGEWTDAAVVP